MEPLQDHFPIFTDCLLKKANKQTKQNKQNKNSNNNDNNKTPCINRFMLKGVWAQICKRYAGIAKTSTYNNS